MAPIQVLVQTRRRSGAVRARPWNIKTNSRSLNCMTEVFSNKALAFTRNLRGSHAIIIFNRDTLHLRKRQASLKTMHVHTWLFRFINFES